MRASAGVHARLALTAAAQCRRARYTLLDLSSLKCIVLLRGVRIGARRGRGKGRDNEDEGNGPILWSDMPSLQPAKPTAVMEDVQGMFAGRTDAQDEDVFADHGPAQTATSTPSRSMRSGGGRERARREGMAMAEGQNTGRGTDSKAAEEEDEGERMEKARRRVMRRLAEDESDMHPDFHSLEGSSSSSPGLPPPPPGIPGRGRGRGRRGQGVEQGEENDDPMSHPDPQIRAAFRAFAAKYGQGGAEAGVDFGAGFEGEGRGGRTGLRTSRTSIEEEAGSDPLGSAAEEYEAASSSQRQEDVGSARIGRGRDRGRGGREKEQRNEHEGGQGGSNGESQYTLPSVIDVSGRAVVPTTSSGRSSDGEEETEREERLSARAQRSRERKERLAARRAAWDASIGGPSPRVLAWDREASDLSSEEDEGEDSEGTGTGTDTEEEEEGEEYGSGSEGDEDGLSASEAASGGSESEEDMEGQEELEAFLARRQAALERRARRGRRAIRESAGFSGPRGEPGLPSTSSSPVPLLAPAIVPSSSAPGGLLSLPRTLSHATHGELLPYTAVVPQVTLDEDILTRIDLLCAGMGCEEVGAVRRATLERRVREVEDGVRARALRKAALAQVYDRRMQKAGEGEGLGRSGSTAPAIPAPLQAFFRGSADPNPNSSGTGAGVGGAREETLALLQAAAVQVSTLPGGRDLLKRSPAALAALALRSAPASAVGRQPAAAASGGKEGGAAGTPPSPTPSANPAAATTAHAQTWLLQASYALAMQADSHIGAGDGGVLAALGSRLGLDLSALGETFKARRAGKRGAEASERERERRERLAAAGLTSDLDDEGRPFGYWDDELGYATGDEPGSLSASSKAKGRGKGSGMGKGSSEEDDGEDGEGDSSSDGSEGEEDVQMEDEDEEVDGLMAGIVLPPEVTLPGLSARAQAAAREGALFLPQAGGKAGKAGITGPGTEAAFWGLEQGVQGSTDDAGQTRRPLARTGSLVGLLPPEIAQKQAAMAEGRAHSELAFAQRLLARAIVANAGKALGLEGQESEGGWFDAGRGRGLGDEAELEGRGEGFPAALPSPHSTSTSLTAQEQQDQLVAVAHAAGVPADTLAAVQAAVRVLSPPSSAAPAPGPAALAPAVLAALLRPYLTSRDGKGGEVGRLRGKAGQGGSLEQRKEAKLPFAPAEAVELATRLGYPARDPATGSALVPSAKELAAVKAFRKLMDSKNPTVLQDVLKRKAELSAALADAPDAQRMVQLLLADVEDEDRRRGEDTGEGIAAVLGPGGKPQAVGAGAGSSLLRDPDHPLAGLTVRTSRLPEGYQSWADVAQHAAVNKKRQKAAERALKAQQQQKLDAVIRAAKPQEGRLNPDTPVGAPGGPTARQQRMGHNMAQMMNALLSDPAWVGPDPSLSGLWPCGLPIEVAEVTLTPNLRTAYVRWQHPVLAKAQGLVAPAPGAGAGRKVSSATAPTYASLIDRIASLSSTASGEALKSAGLHPVLKKRGVRTPAALGSAGYDLASMDSPATATTRRIYEDTLAAAEKRVARYTESHTKPRRGDRFGPGGVDSTARSAQVPDKSLQAVPQVQGLVDGMHAALERHAGMLRRALAARMGLRYTPELQFHRYLGPRKGQGKGQGEEDNEDRALGEEARRTGRAFTGKSKLEQEIRM